MRIHVRLKHRSASASSTSPSKAASPSKADSASQPDESQLQLLVVEACEQDTLQVPNYSVMQLLADIAECCPRTDGIVIAQLHQIQATSHYALQVDFGTHVRPCDKVLALIVSTKKAVQDTLSENAVSLTATGVLDGIAVMSEPRRQDCQEYSVVGMCTRSALKDVLLDPPRSGTKRQAALAMITAVAS